MGYVVLARVLESRHMHGTHVVPCCPRPKNILGRAYNFVSWAGPFGTTQMYRYTSTYQYNEILCHPVKLIWCTLDTQ
jgi:hypothetical protein